MKQKNKLLDGTLKRILRDTRSIALWVGLSALLGMLAVLCAAAAPEILGQLVQMLCDYGAACAAQPIRPSLIRGLTVLVVLYSLNALCRYGTVQIMNRAVSRNFTCGLRIKISEKLGKLPVKYVDQTPVGDILDRMTRDVGEMGGYIHQIFNVMIGGMFQILVVSIAMLLENWVLAIFVLLLTPVSMLLSSKMGGICGKYYDRNFEIRGEMTQLVEENFTNFSTAKAYNLEDYAAEKHAAINEALRKSTEMANFTSSVVQPIIKFTNALAYVSINLVGGWLAIRQGVPVGTVVTIVLFARQFASPLEQIADGFANINYVKACAKRVYEILDLPEEVQTQGQFPQQTNGQVRFEQVCFSYDREKPLLQDLNLEVKPGQKIAIVGPTGAGKTTIVNLLMRFYDLDSGRITLDGADIAGLSREEVRGQFAMVLQDTWLFRGTIEENVAYGRPGATRAEVENACRRAYCDHFIRTMPKGYDTVISEDTTSLSGGQKQLLTIARALLADRPLLILDEATSNVDTRTELLIQKAMDRLMAGKTCFVIAHRLSTIIDSDVILVLEEGRVVEQGSHGELMEKRGVYHRLFTSQYGS